MRMLSALALLLTLSACAKRVECNVHGGDSWLDGETERFHIRTNLPEAELQKEGERLEALLNVLHGVHGSSAAKTKSEKIEVIILAKREQLEEYTDALGYALRGGLFVLAADDKQEDQELQKQAPGWKLSSTLTHELAHHVHAHILIRSPRWIAEGLATYEETIELNQELTTAFVGAEASGRLYGVYVNGVLPLEELWEWGRAVSTANERRQYESAWIWVHFFFNRRRADMDAWIKRLSTPEDPRKSFDAVFGSDYAKLKKELDAYLEERAYQLQQYGNVSPRVKVATKPLSPARVHLARADLARTAVNGDDEEEREEKASEEVKKAAKLDPSDLQVRIELAKLVEPRPARIEQIKALTQAEPNRADVWWLLASEQMKGAQYEDIVTALRKTIELDPNNSDALANLAYFTARKGERLAEAKSYAERAVEREPWNPHFMDTLALVLAASGDCPGATQKQTHAVELLSEYAADKQRLEYQQRLEDYRAGCKKK